MAAYGGEIPPEMRSRPPRFTLINAPDAPVYETSTGHERNQLDGRRLFGRKVLTREMNRVPSCISLHQIPRRPLTDSRGTPRGGLEERDPIRPRWPEILRRRHWQECRLRGIGSSLPR